MNLRTTLVVIAGWTVASLAAADTPPVKLLTSDQVKSCEVKGIITGSHFSMTQPKKAGDRAMEDALKKALAAGADSVVVQNTMIGGNYHYVVVQALNRRPKA